jgi:hypothetical protein
VNESDKFQIELLTSFERTLEKLIRDRYRKNPAGKAEFDTLIEKLIDILTVDPRPRPPLGSLEPWPKGTSCEGWELWKLKFPMPKISSGAARQGRLIYLINGAEKKVGFIWIYTHAEFEKRPSDKILKDLLEEFIKSSEDLDKNHQLSEDIVSEVQDEELEEPKGKKPVSES